jgi:hypothetical protein
MLAVWDFSAFDIHAANGIKNFSPCASTALRRPSSSGAVDWPVAGSCRRRDRGWLARAVRPIHRKDKARAAVVAIGFLVTAILLVEQSRR